MSASDLSRRRAASPLPPPDALALELARVAELHAERVADPALASALERLARWQGRRLVQTYADLSAQPRFAPAVEFFENDLYGGADFARRDADLARIAPMMARMLPASVIATVAAAVELNRMSQELDRALLARLPPEGAAFTVGDYARAYRGMGQRAARERQIRMIGEIGAALDGFVRMPFIYGALVMMHHPARLAGFATLHDFLERGFAAFRRMDGADEFLATIHRREWALMEAIFGGDDAPFPEPEVADGGIAR
jgi:hypothetical protein